jgi:hypothetical protein
MLALPWWWGQLEITVAIGGGTVVPVDSLVDTEPFIRYYSQGYQQTEIEA